MPEETLDLTANASEVIRESLRLLKEHDEIRVKLRWQIERGWLDAQAGRVVHGRKQRTMLRRRPRELSSCAAE